MTLLRMNSSSTTERCKALLTKWRSNLSLSNHEKTHFSHELNTLDEQIKRLARKRLRLSVFGRVGVGKSSVLNALLEEDVFTTDITHGSTYQNQIAIWNQSIKNLHSIELIDTPGIDEIDSQRRKKITSTVSTQSDLILFVIDSDLTSVDLESLQKLLNIGKPIFLILNRCDQWTPNQIKDVEKSIKKRLPMNAKNLEIHSIAAAPRQSKLFANGKVRSQVSSPRINPLRKSLINLLKNQGELLLALNSLRLADDFYQCLKKNRLRRGKSKAQGLIGKFAALKASGVAASPLLMLDLTAGLACDTALVIELSKLYGLQLRGPAARDLLKRLSIYNALLGGTQLTIQYCLGVIRHILIVISPFTGGLSLAPAAPVAIAQAALAIHTTKLTGRLAAKEFLKGSHRRDIQPRSIIYRLALTDPEVSNLISLWPQSITSFKRNHEMQSIIP